VTDPPYRIVTERTILRCWSPRDAPALKDAIDASLDHLRPWMEWAKDEPQSLEEKVALLRRFRGEFDLGRNFVYGILDLDDATVLGGTGLHPRGGEDAVEIGYWIHASHAGRGLGTETTAALTRVAFQVCGVGRVDIRVDPTNHASLAIPRKLGFNEEATLRRRLPPHHDGERRDMTVFSLFHDELSESPASQVPFEAYDARGERIPTA
jgi:RimJ/RimL family protein N-acetyltransferase